MSIYDFDEEFYETDFQNSAFSNFVSNPSKETMQLLNEDELKMLVEVATQVDRKVVGDISIEDEHGRTVVINSKLSKQILNYIQGFRVKCDFGNCVPERTGNINVPYGQNEFFSKEECEKKCTALPVEILNTINHMYVDDNTAILDHRGITSAKTGLPFRKDEYVFITKMEVNSNVEDNINIINKFSNLTHLIFGDNFDQHVDNLDTSRLRHLAFGREFNKSINNLDFSNLTHLIFGLFYNQAINMDLKDVRYIKFGSTFDRPIVNLDLSRVYHLEFGHDFNRPLAGMDFSELRFLKFGDEFDQDIRSAVFPNVVYVVFGDSFDHPVTTTINGVNQLIFPKAIFIKFGDNFDQPFNNDAIVLPDLVHLEFGYHFIQSLETLIAPKLSFLRIRETLVGYLSDDITQVIGRPGFTLELF
jgi:hypothetical protein